MSDRSRKHRKRFACGHRGYGRYCHRCDHQQVQRTAKRRQRQSQRQEWQALFLADPIDLKSLPKPVVKKARNVLQALQRGTYYWQLSGKRLNMAREVISIPVTRRYRLLCQDTHDGIQPVKVISHEAYNPLVTRPKRLAQTLLNKISRFTRGTQERLK